jgi:hypothetical protein
MHTRGKIGVFLLLDATLVIILFSMLFCMHPVRLEFISEWIRQCQADQQARVLPILLVITMACIVTLQMDWMYRVSLHHLQLVARLEITSIRKSAVLLPERDATDETRTLIVIKMLTYKPKQHIVCADGHSDAMFMASFAAIVGIAVTVYFSWKSPENWTHYYGVLLFCSGFFCILQIVWLNLQRVSAVASLRHMPPMSGMHWLVDSAIILFLFTFLILNFILGQIGPIVVVSELLGFALLLFQFMYVFQVCCRSSEPLVVQRSAAWRTRLLLCVLLIIPIFLPQLH